MARMKNRNMLDVFIFQFIKKYNVKKFVMEKFIMDFFLHFIYSARSVEDVQRILCLPEDTSEIAFLQIFLFKEFINSFSDINDIYNFLRHPQDIGRSEMLCADDSCKKSERLLYDKFSKEFDMSSSKIQTCMIHFLLTLENCIYKKLLEYENIYGPCSMNFCFEGQESIYGLNLSGCTLKSLKDLGFDSIQEITQFSLNEFRNSFYMSDAMYNNVITAVEQHNSSFRKDGTPYEGPIYLLKCKKR